MQRKGIDRSIILLAVIVVVVAATIVLVALYVRTDEVSEAVAAGHRIGILLTFDLGDGRLITEAFFYQPGTNRGALFDIPAHAGVVVRSLNRVDSIDTIYFADGPDVYRRSVATLLAEEVPFYISMDTAQLQAVADLVEGVPIFVADVPNEGPDAVRIPNGDVILDGAKILTYATYEVEGERERERIARHQRLAVGLLDRLGAQAGMFENANARRLLHENVTTNLDRSALGAVVSALSTLQGDRVITRQIEGITRSVETEGGTKQLLFPHQEGRWLVESVRQVVENLQSEDAIRDENLVIRLEILNGTPIRGLASRTAELYRSYGFDVVAVGNAASSEIEETLIVDRVGNEVFAGRTADIIRAPSTSVDLDGQAAVDVTVILGKDFDGRYVR